jgi:hypothetical protein
MVLERVSRRSLLRAGRWGWGPPCVHLHRAEGTSDDARERAHVFELHLPDALHVAFNARLGRGTDDAGTPDVYAMARPDLRNFDGALPLHIDTNRPHHAYVTVGLDLAADGRASGYLQPSLHYYDEEGGSPDIGASADWDSEATPPADPLTAIDITGRFVTPSTYRGSPREPRVILTARADAVEPPTDVDVIVRVDGGVIRRGRVEPGTYFELGEHPFGVSISLDVENAEVSIDLAA